MGKKLKSHFASKKLDLHKEEVGRGFGLNIGMSLDEGSKVLRAEATKIALVCRATEAYARRQLGSAETLEVLLGSWAWIMLVSRVGYSVFSVSYAFVHRFRGKGLQQIWPVVRQELLAAAAIGPLLYVRLDLPWMLVAMMTDATDTGYGVVSTPCTVEEIRREREVNGRQIWIEELSRQLAAEGNEDTEGVNTEGVETQELVRGDSCRGERRKNGKGLLVSGGVGPAVVSASRAARQWWCEIAEADQGRLGSLKVPKILKRTLERIRRGVFFMVVLGPDLEKVMDAAEQVVSACVEENVTVCVVGRKRGAMWKSEVLNRLREEGRLRGGKIASLGSLCLRREAAAADAEVDERNFSLEFGAALPMRSAACRSSGGELEGRNLMGIMEYGFGGSSVEADRRACPASGKTRDGEERPSNARAVLGGVERRQQVECDLRRGVRAEGPDSHTRIEDAVFGTEMGSKVVEKL